MQESPRQVLETDGPSPIYHENFGLFQATITDFKAMRDQIEGEKASFSRTPSEQFYS